MILCLVSGSYPYSIALEDTFLKLEVELMARRFDKVYIFPKDCSGEIVEIPSTISLSCEYSDAISTKKCSKLVLIPKILVSSLASREFYAELFGNILAFRNLSNLKWLFVYLYKKNVTAKFFRKWVFDNKFQGEQIVFYTFWLDDSTHGIGEAIQSFPSMSVISRAHGFDIYNERVSPPYWPCRPKIFEFVKYVLADSKLGCEYLIGRYGLFRHKINYSYMGVQDPEFTTSSSDDEVLRITSCSMIRKLKRIDLLIHSLKRFSELHPNIPVIWTHFGNSTSELEIVELKEIVHQQNFPENVVCNFPGYEDQSALMNFYKNNRIDVFVTLSQSEGTPISVLEALSCGIPIIATAVGGIVDLVSDKNGFLLDPDPPPIVVADKLFEIYCLRGLSKLDDLKNGSKLLWENDFDATKNYYRFFNDIAN